MWTTGAARAPHGRPRRPRGVGRVPPRAVRPVRPPASPSRSWPAPRPARVLPETPTDAEKACYPGRSLPSLAAAAWLGTLCVIAAQLMFEARNLGSVPVVAGIFGGYT